MSANQSHYQIILAPVSDVESGTTSLAAGIQLAKAFDAHLRVLHVRTDPATAVPLVGEGMSGAMVDEMMSLAERQASERAAAVRGMVEAQLTRAALPLVDEPAQAGDKASAELSDETGREEEVVALKARLSDLVVIARPPLEHEAPAMMTLNAALMEGGRPVLVIPPLALNSVGKRVAIAWNGSPQAARAVAAAMPLLRQAERVVCLSAREDAAVSPGDLASYLAWHGIQSTCHSFGLEGSSTGEALLRQAAQHDADLLVMGAYTHSRLRQLIMGGVTRHVLHAAGLPVLMSH